MAACFTATIRSHLDRDLAKLGHTMDGRRARNPIDWISGLVQAPKPPSLVRNSIGSIAKTPRNRGTSQATQDPGREVSAPAD
jgi:hypothetical protein